IRIGDQDCRVIGVVRNMVMGSPYDPVPATLISLDYKFVNYITIRLNPAISPGVAINRIRAVFKRFDPHAPFEFAYLADDYSRKFAAESQLGSLSVFFAGLAIGISCLGLYGLAAFMIERRRKEVAIRRTLGAGIPQP